MAALIQAEADACAAVHGNGGTRTQARQAVAAAAKAARQFPARRLFGNGNSAASINSTSRMFFIRGPDRLARDCPDRFQYAKSYRKGKGKSQRGKSTGKGSVGMAADLMVATYSRWSTSTTREITTHYCV